MRRKKEYKRLFTLIEMLSAMAIFMIISVVMMQFFSSSQQIITRASQRNQSFADVRVAFELMTKDLQCALYRNDLVTSPKAQDIFPFWFQTISNVTANSYYSTNLEWNCLNFLSATELSNGGNSNVCELRYSFVPAGETFINPVSGTDIGEGWLIRSCTNDVDNPAIYNFSANPLTDGTGVDDDKRMKKIWLVDDGTSDGGSISEPAQQANASYADFERVIPNVYKLSFTCYNKELQTGGTTQMDAAASSNVGTPFPTAIKVELEVLSPQDWDMWKKFLDNSKQTEADALLDDKLRRFSKIIYLPRKKTL